MANTPPNKPDEASASAEAPKGLPITPGTSIDESVAIADAMEAEGPPMALEHIAGSTDDTSIQDLRTLFVHEFEHHQEHIRSSEPWEVDDRTIEVLSSLAYEHPLLGPVAAEQLDRILHGLKGAEINPDTARQIIEQARAAGISPAGLHELQGVFGGLDVDVNAGASAEDVTVAPVSGGWSGSVLEELNISGDLDEAALLRAQKSLSRYGGSLTPDIVKQIMSEAETSGDFTDAPGGLDRLEKALSRHVKISPKI